jgi:hypothetical protein
VAIHGAVERGAVLHQRPEVGQHRQRGEAARAERAVHEPGGLLDVHRGRIDVKAAHERRQRHGIHLEGRGDQHEQRRHPPRARGLRDLGADPGGEAPARRGGLAAAQLAGEEVGGQTGPLPQRLEPVLQEHEELRVPLQDVVDGIPERAHHLGPVERARDPQVVHDHRGAGRHVVHPPGHDVVAQVDGDDEGGVAAAAQQAARLDEVLRRIPAVHARVVDGDAPAQTAREARLEQAGEGLAVLDLQRLHERVADDEHASRLVVAARGSYAHPLGVGVEVDRPLAGIDRRVHIGAVDVPERVRRLPDVGAHLDQLLRRDEPYRDLG